MGRNRRRIVGPTGAVPIVCLALAVSLSPPGCTEEAWINATRPLGDSLLPSVGVARTGFLYDPNSPGLYSFSTPGRGDLGIGFINRTPYRAIGTFGGYDPQDQDTFVGLGQLGVTAELELEPNSAGRVWAMPVTRAFSIGGRRLIDLVLDNDLHHELFVIYRFPVPFPSAVLNSTIFQFVPTGDLLYEGIGFSGAPFDDPQRWVATEGTAPPMVVSLGVDYRSDDILIFDFVEDANSPGGFAIEFRTASDLGVDRDRLVELSVSERLRYLEGFGLERLTFELLTTLGLSKQTALFASSPGVPSADPELTITNGVSTMLTLSFTGPQSVITTIAAGGTETLVLTPGEYQFIAAHEGVSAPFVGTQTFDAGFTYTATFVFN